MSPPDLQEHRIACRCCPAACGMIATVRGAEILRLDGDPDHPVSGGYSCAKGRAIPERHHHASRLNGPRLAGVEASWDDCLSDLAGRLKTLRAESGPDAVGVFGGTGGAWDTLGWWASTQLVKALGTAQYYTVGTVDTAPLYRAAELVTGYYSVQPAWVPDESGPSMVILLGTNPCVSHGYLGADWPNPVHRLREYRKGGGELWTIDPRETKTALISDRHLAPRPGSDVFLLAWLVRELLREGCDQGELSGHCAAGDIEALRAGVERFDLAFAIAGTGLPAQGLQDLLAAIRRNGKIAILAGTGVSFGAHGLLAEWLRWALLIVTGSLDTPGGMFFPVTSLARMEDLPWNTPAPAEGRSDAAPASRPDLRGFMGQHAASAVVDEIEAGNLRALIVFGGNPLTCLPDAERTEAALRSLEVLVVVDPFENDLTRIATHVLSTTWLLERSDIKQRPTRVEYSPAILPPGADRRPGWWIMAAIAERLGLHLFGDDLALGDMDEAKVFGLMLTKARVSYEALAAAGKHGIPTPQIIGWFHEKVLGDRGWRIAPAALLERLAKVRPATAKGAVLVTGRVAYATNSVLFPPAVRRTDIPPAIHLSPDLAAARGVVHGDLIELVSEFGVLEGTAEIDASLHPGTVWMNHGWTRRNVNALIDGRQIDALTTQPYFSAVPLEVRRVETGKTGTRAGV
jgi:anaerobic selenocysteine-containing dehydrogenase